MDGEDVRVVECGGGARLLLEASDALVVAREVRGQEFERDAPTEARVLRQVDRAHSALAEFFENAIGAERRPTGNDFRLVFRFAFGGVGRAEG